MHLTAFVRDPTASYGLKLWVPRRAKTKQTYGGMLDNTVAGGMATGEEPLECVIREAAEEASLPEEVVRKNVTAAGTITYMLLRDAKAGGETGLVQPECQYVYELELPADIIPKPCDGEVEVNIPLHPLHLLPFTYLPILPHETKPNPNHFSQTNRNSTSGP